MVVVTGASGFVGGNVVRALLDQGIAVRAVVRRDRRSMAGLPVEVVYGDLSDPESLLKAFKESGAVFHFAGSISLEADNWEEMEAVNVTGTRNVVQACLDCGIPRLVYCSSIQALEQIPLDQPLDEERPRITLDGHTAYDRSKAAAELEVLAGIEKGLDAVLLNPTAVVGPNDYKPSFVGRALLQLGLGRIPVLVQGGFDWVDVRDVAAAAVRAWQVAPPGRRYILSGHWCSVIGVARLVANHTGRRAPGLAVPLWLAHLASPVFDHIARFNRKEPIYTRSTLLALRSNRKISHERANAELGYSPRPLEQTIHDALSWFQQNSYFEAARSG